MNLESVIDRIKEKFSKTGQIFEIPNLKNETFQAELCSDGIKVSNLGNEPLLVWDVFKETVQLLLINSGWAYKGDALNAKLGDPNLPMDSIEGRVSSFVYKKNKSDKILSRIVPIASILIWAGICKDAAESLKFADDLLSLDEINFTVHWYYYLALEKDVEALSRYIEFSEGNFNTYSIQLTHLLLAISSEVDVVAKAICIEIDHKSKARNIDDYCKTILKHFSNICKESIQIPRYKLSFIPWESWDTNDSPIWWKAYNAVKHNRGIFFEKANLANVLNALAGLLVLILYLRKAQNYNSKNVHSNIIYSVFNPRPQLYKFSDPYYDYFENNK